MSLVCLIVAIILFVLEAVGFTGLPVPLVPLGLAFFAAASLPWGSIVVNRK